MKKPLAKKLLHLSARWYERLLIFYPPKHRAEYGDAMAQLFRDQSRDALRDAGGRGLLVLWLRVMHDLLKTLFIEHLANLKGKMFMPKKFFTRASPSPAAWAAFLVVFIVTFGFILTTAMIVTFILPESYASRTVIKINGGSPAGITPGTYDPYLIQTESTIIQSEIILDKVIEQLDLNTRLQKKYGSDTKFKTSESRQALKRMIELRPERNTPLVEITAFSEDKQEAALIANSIAENYQKYIADVNQKQVGTKITVEVIEHAEPSFRPVRPNKPLNIFLGAVIGGMLGLFAGGIAAIIVSRLQNNGRKSPPSIPQPVGVA